MEISKILHKLQQEHELEFEPKEFEEQFNSLQNEGGDRIIYTTKGEEYSMMLSGRDCLLVVKVVSCIDLNEDAEPFVD
jgi:hypothetical protein